MLAVLYVLVLSLLLQQASFALLTTRPSVVRSSRSRLQVAYDPKSKRDFDNKANINTNTKLELREMLMPRTPNLPSILWTVAGEGVLLNLGIFLGLAFGVPVLGSFSPWTSIASTSTSNMALETISAASFWATFAALAGALLDKIPALKQVALETRFFVLRMLGRNSSKWQAFSASLLVSSAAGFAEEVFFRGFVLQVIQQALEHSGLVVASAATPIALAASSIIFGLAHSPLWGASVLVETFLGSIFGLAFILSGFNLAVPIIAHIVYDTVTFFFVWLEASSDLNARILAATETKLVQLSSTDERQFAAICKAVFDLLDLDGDGSIDKRELELGIRLFNLGSAPFAGVFRGTGGKGQQAPLTAQQLLLRYDLNKDGKISRGEFEKVMKEGLYRWPERLEVM